MMLIARNVAPTPTSELVGASQMLYSIPRVAERTDAAVVLPGLREHWRITNAIEI